MSLFKTKIFTKPRYVCRAFLKITHKTLTQPLEIGLLKHVIANGKFKFVFYDYVDGHASKFLYQLYMNNDKCKTEMQMHGPSAPNYGDDCEVTSMFNSSYGMLINNIVFQTYSFDPAVNKVTITGRITYE